MVTLQVREHPRCDRIVERRHTEGAKIAPLWLRDLRFFSIAHERYLLAVARESPLSLKSEIDIEDLRSEKIISFSRQNLCYSERYFAEKFEEHDLTGNVAYTCDDTFSLVSLVSAGLGIGFVPEWTQDLPNRGFELKKVKGIDFSAPGDRQGACGESPLR